MKYRSPARSSIGKSVLGKYISYKVFLSIFSLLGIILALFIIYTYYQFHENSKPVYFKNTNFKMKGSSYVRGSSNLTDLYISDIFSVDTHNVLVKDTVEIQRFSWSSWSIHRRIFLRTEEILKADTLYAYLYKSDYEYFWDSSLFGLSANHPPSRIYLYSDILRTSLRNFIAIGLIILGAFYYLNDKFYKQDKKHNNQNLNFKLWHFFLIMTVFFIFSS